MNNSEDVSQCDPNASLLPRDYNTIVSGAKKRTRPQGHSEMTVSRHQGVYIPSAQAWRFTTTYLETGRTGIFQMINSTGDQDVVSSN